MLQKKVYKNFYEEPMTPTFLQVPMEPKKLAQFCTSQICLCMKLYAVDWDTESCTI